MTIQSPFPLPEDMQKKEKRAREREGWLQSSACVFEACVCTLNHDGSLCCLVISKRSTCQ